MCLDNFNGSVYREKGRGPDMKPFGTPQETKILTSVKLKVQLKQEEKTPSEKELLTHFKNALITNFTILRRLDSDFSKTVLSV